MTTCNYADDKKVRPISLHSRKTESGFDLGNGLSVDFNLFCSLNRAGASMSRICAVMRINDEKFRQLAKSAGIAVRRSRTSWGSYYYRSY